LSPLSRSFPPLLSSSSLLSIPCFSLFLLSAFLPHPSSITGVFAFLLLPGKSSLLYRFFYSCMGFFLLDYFLLLWPSLNVLRLGWERKIFKRRNCWSIYKVLHKHLANIYSQLFYAVHSREVYLKGKTSFPCWGNNQVNGRDTQAMNQKHKE
jgi:hypothetical protein